MRAFARSHDLPLSRGGARSVGRVPVVLRPIRFSVAATGLHSATGLAELARRAEGLGYSTLTIADHLDGQLAPLPALVAAASATTTLRVGTLVLANDYRNPVVLAKEAATVDLLTDGRFELGIGAGWMASDYRQTGLSYDPPATRIERLAETVTILKGLFADGVFTHHGTHYDIAEIEGTPKPVQRPHPPLLIAGGRPQILRLAAREADIVGVNPSLAAGVVDERAGPSATPASTDAKIRWIREAAGDRFDGLTLQTRVHLAAITDDRDGFAAVMAPALGVTPEDALNSPHALVGTVGQCVDSLHEWRERWGITAIGIDSSSMDELAPVLARVS